MFKLIGKNSELLLARLKSWRLSDGNGIEGDSLSLTINSDDIDGIPPKGEQYSVYLGDVLRDEFQISKRSISLHPREVVLVLSVAPFSIKDETMFYLFMFVYYIYLMLVDIIIFRLKNLETG